MIPLKETLHKYGLKPKGVIQVGSHYAEEHEEFVKCGIERFVYIEPCKEAFQILERNTIVVPAIIHINNSKEDNIPKVVCINCACGSEEKEMPMYVSHQNQGQSNSLLKPQLHLQQHPEIIFDDAEIVKVIPLDSLPIDKTQYDFLYLDVQGYEGEVLKGAVETLKHIDVIYTECNRGQTYEGNMEIREMDDFLAQHGFICVEIFWPSENWTWGDAIYIKAKDYVTLDKELIGKYKKIIS